MLHRINSARRATAPCGLAGVSCTQCAQLHGCPTLRGLGIISLPAIPEWLKDWRIWAVLGAVVLLAGTGILGGKGAKKRRRKRLMLARLKYEQERLK